MLYVPITSPQKHRSGFLGYSWLPSRLNQKRSNGWSCRKSSSSISHGLMMRTTSRLKSRHGLRAPLSGFPCYREGLLQVCNSHVSTCWSEPSHSLLRLFLECLEKTRTLDQYQLKLNKTLSPKELKTMNCQKASLWESPNRRYAFNKYEKANTKSKCLPLKIPDNVKLQKETVLSLVKGSTVFINYLGEPRNLLFLSICWWYLGSCYVRLSTGTRMICVYDASLFILAPMMSPCQNNTRAYQLLMY